MNTSRDQRVGTTVLLLFVLAFSVCMPICDLDDHHGPSAGHGVLCAIDMPQVFQLLALMVFSFLAVLTGIVVPRAPTFSLLKPPRFVSLQLTDQ